MIKILELTTLVTRIRCDLPEMFKILNGLENIDSSDFFMVTEKQTQGYKLKLFKKCCMLDCLKFSFAHRIVNLWNALPDKITACDSIHTFKGLWTSFRMIAG